MSVALEPRYIIETVERLQKRIGERFPKSGLLKIAESVAKAARDADHKSAGIAKVHMPLRAVIWLLVATLLGGLYAAFFRMSTAPVFSSVADLIQSVDAAANIVLLMGAGILSISKFEESLRRRKALTLVYDLKAMAHVVDMHQLTKDPESVADKGHRTESSPKRTMTPFELGRYLDYSSELLSIIGKVAAIYGRRLQDPVVLDAIDGAEDLTTGLSRKIWQKIAILTDHPAAKR